MKKIDKPLYEHLGRQLKEARIKKGYSLQEVADMIGKNKTSIKRYEDAAVRIDMDTLNLLCLVLDVKPTPMYISTGDRDVERIVLSEIPESEHELLPYEDGYQEKIQATLSEQLFEKFMQLDENSQRIVLMMLHMEDVDGIMEQIKK